MTKIDTLRQSGIIPNNKLERTSVEIAGVGAIGSHACEALCKMGIPKFIIYDDDVVEKHNIANQGYYMQDLGKPKVEALSVRMHEGTGAEFAAKQERVTAKTRFSCDFVVSGVDNMAARKEIWDAFIASPSRYLIDGRMGARFGQIFIVDKLSVEQMPLYETTLFDDAEGEQVPCTEKSTIFCAYGLGGLICAVIAKLIIGDEIDYNSLEIDFVNLRMIQNKLVQK